MTSDGFVDLDDLPVDDLDGGYLLFITACIALLPLMWAVTYWAQLVTYLQDRKERPTK